MNSQSLYSRHRFIIEAVTLCFTFLCYWVRKLTGKPASLTIADCEFDARRIHGIYETGISFLATESNARRIHSDFVFRDLAIAACIALASGGVNRAAKSFPLAFCVPIFGRPTFLFIIIVNKYVDAIIISVNNIVNEIKTIWQTNLRLRKR